MSNGSKYMSLILMSYHIHIEAFGLHNYYEDMFICKNGEVDEHLQQVGYKDDMVNL